MPALCTGFYFPFAIWMRWVLDWIGIGSRLPQENHARPLQWVVHTGGYLEVPPDPRHSSSHQMLLDLGDHIPLERGRPPPGGGWEGENSTPQDLNDHHTKNPLVRGWLKLIRVPRRLSQPRSLL